MHAQQRPGYLSLSMSDILLGREDEAKAWEYIEQVMGTTDTLHRLQQDCGYEKASMSPLGWDMQEATGAHCLRRWSPSA